jgi:hypothetical protein
MVASLGFPAFPNYCSVPLTCIRRLRLVTYPITSETRVAKCSVVVQVPLHHVGQVSDFTRLSIPGLVRPARTPDIGRAWRGGRTHMRGNARPWQRIGRAATA